MSVSQRKISFPADSVLNAVIQDADISELIQILKNKRGKVNINQKNHVGLTALHQAVLSNNLDAVKMLLNHGSDVNAQDVNGFTPLHIASACGFIQVSSLLLIHNADVFLMNKHAEYPIDMTKDINIVRLFSEEMCRRLQSEIYVQSFIVSKLSHLWTVILKCMKCVFKVCVDVYRNYFTNPTVTQRDNSVKDAVTESDSIKMKKTLSSSLDSINVSSGNGLHTKKCYKDKYD